MNVTHFVPMEPFGKLLAQYPETKSIFHVYRKHIMKTDIIIIQDYELFAGWADSSNYEQSNNHNSHNTAVGIAIAIHRSIINKIHKIIRISGGNGHTLKRWA